MENCLRKIVAQETFTRNEAKEIMHEIVDQKYSDMQIAAILMGIQTRGVTVHLLVFCCCRRWLQSCKARKLRRFVGEWCEQRARSPRC